MIAEGAMMSSLLRWEITREHERLMQETADRQWLV